MSWKPEDDKEPQYSLCFPFTDQSRSFALGFECGRLDHMMDRRVANWIGPIHEENDEQLLLMARYHGYSATFSPLSDGWLQCRLVRLP